MMEIWKDIKDYEGLYQVSNLGRVKNLYDGRHKKFREKILQQQKTKKSYLVVTLQKEKVRKQFFVHRLVAQTFLPNPNNLPEVNHKSEIKTQNNVENLEWCNNDYNIHYGTGIIRGSENRKGKTLKEETKKKIGESLSKAILQINKDTDVIIKEWSSMAEIKRELGYNQSNISKCCNGKLRNNTSYGYKWQYKEVS